MTPEVLHKLEEAFAIGCSDTEACSYADISPRTLYKYQEEEPEFIQRKEQLKEKPILKAKNTIVKALGEPEHAKWYLERRVDDFKPKTKTETETKLIIEDFASLEDAVKRLNELEKNAIHKGTSISSNGTSPDSLDKEVPDQN